LSTPRPVSAEGDANLADAAYRRLTAPPGCSQGTAGTNPAHRTGGTRRDHLLRWLVAGVAPPLQRRAGPPGPAREHHPTTNTDALRSPSSQGQGLPLGPE